MKYLCKRNYNKPASSQPLEFFIKGNTYYDCESFIVSFTGVTTLNFMNVYGELGNMHRFQMDDFYSMFYTKIEERKIKLKKLNETSNCRIRQ